MKDVCILIPTLNEEETIGELIAEFKREGFDNIFVIDGNSTDATREIAKRAGVKVEIQRGKGKGIAVRQAFEEIESEIIVMIDGDGTYSPSEARTLIGPILNHEAEHVVGNRFAYGGAFARLHRFGNWGLNRVFSVGYGTKLSDILSGYRAFTKAAVNRMELAKEGFEIEVEMAIESVKKGMRIKEVPITYKERKGESKLHFLRDGARIAYTLYVLAKTHNPLFYFGIIGFSFIAIGVISGIYVVLEWLKNITHIPLTVFTSLMIISGVQFLIFGLLGDLIVTLQKEMLAALRDRSRKGE
jgi:dolichol-phosphate mannosyltransferase